jgi:hypothetical protein
VKGLWTLRERITYTLLTLGILGCMFLLRDFGEVMFWGSGNPDKPVAQLIQKSGNIL